MRTVISFAHYFFPAPCRSPDVEKRLKPSGSDPHIAPEFARNLSAYSHPDFAHRSGPAASITFSVMTARSSE